MALVKEAYVGDVEWLQVQWPEPWVAHAWHWTKSVVCIQCGQF